MNDHSDSDCGYVKVSSRDLKKEGLWNLRKLCGELAVSASGTKAKMVARILAARTTSSADEVDRANSFRASLEKESVVKLRNMCHELNVPTSRKKADMIQCILNASSAAPAQTLVSGTQPGATSTKEGAEYTEWVARQRNIRIRHFPSQDGSHLSEHRTEKEEPFLIVEERHIDDMLHLRLADC